jgi:hypothetical protein
MKSRINWVLTLMIACSLVAISPVAAQEKRQEHVQDHSFVFAGTQDVVGPAGFHFAFGQAEDSFVFLASDMSFDAKLVKGAPYSAQSTTETIQLLADGNRIVQKNSSTIYRDSEGRTRRDQTINAVGPFSVGGESRTMIFINDPVAGVRYVLEPEDRTGRKLPFKSEMVMRVPSTKVGQGERTEIRTESRVEQHRQVVRGAGPGKPGAAGGVLTGVPGEFVWERRIESPMGTPPKTEALGEQMFEGVRAEGTRSTITIPAGRIGNDLPINIVTERWYSPELQSVVMHKHSDPRLGETTFRLTNINRTEPARSLFEMPADYSVKKVMPDDMKMKIETELKRSRPPGNDQ